MAEELPGYCNPALVPFRVVATFTLVQLFCLLFCYGITWAGLIGISFPVFIMALVPVRHAVLPKFFEEAHLQLLDGPE